MHFDSDVRKIIELSGLDARCQRNEAIHSLGIEILQLGEAVEILCAALRVAYDGNLWLTRDS